ncbi:MAG: hypothetical protein D6E12_08495 [Desulfovibrio sp.]|nr:MAG: hypothetical protein D6E12_08495 [Desulfovibrio sp.]
MTRSLRRALLLALCVVLVSACGQGGGSGDEEPGLDPQELARMLDEEREARQQAEQRAQTAESRIAELESERDQAVEDRIQALKEAAAATEAALEAKNTRNLWLGFGGGALVMALIAGVALGSRTRRAASRQHASQNSAAPASVDTGDAVDSHDEPPALDT